MDGGCHFIATFMNSHPGAIGSALRLYRALRLHCRDQLHDNMYQSGGLLEKLAATRLLRGRTEGQTLGIDHTLDLCDESIP